jgi:hypothetical protein
MILFRHATVQLNAFLRARTNVKLIMDTKELSSRIDSFESTFRTFAEAGLFSTEKAEASFKRARLSPLPSSFLDLLLTVATKQLRKQISQRGGLPDDSALTPSIDPRPRTISEQIAHSIRTARDLVDHKNLTYAAEELTRGELLFQREICRRSRTWRLIRVHQVPLFSFYLLCLSTLAVLALSPVHLWFTSLWGVPSPVLALGMLGALLRGLYWLQFQVSRRIFRAPFILAHFAAPWVGLLLAVASYLLVKGGLLTLQASPGNDFLIRVVAFFAGFNWTWFLTRLNRAFEDSALGSSVTK